MSWSGNATIGYKAVGNNFVNSRFSGNGARLIACLNSTSNNSWTNIIHKLSKNQEFYYDPMMLYQPKIDQRVLPYLRLGITPNVSITYFPSVVDGSSEAIHIPRGLPFGQSNQMSVYVCA